MPKVEWEKEALDDLNKISWFSRHFSNITPESLSGDMAGLFKLRIGDWRVIYSIENDVIVIQAVGHRKEIYK